MSHARTRRTRLLVRLGSALALTCLLPAVPLHAQRIDPALYGAMRWRLIGPFRGGRTVAASGVPQQPNVFYVAANNGGVWKTTDAGRTWAPIFDGQDTGSIGALAVAPSNPDIIYVGSGEGLQRPDLSVGDGMYKSTDGGRTWQHLGLRQGQQISAIVVDPRNPDRLFVAVLGHPYGPNPERGVFRSTDGGTTWQRVLYKDENTGAVDLALDPSNPMHVYAVLWAARQGPWEYDNAYRGPGSGLFESTDGGDTWHPLTDGLPSFQDGLGRIGIGIAPSAPQRMFALVQASRAAGGLYRSDDAGRHWSKVNAEVRIWGRGDDFACVRVDPKNPDVVYVANTSTYRSTDGGRTFTAIKGAPGGDDYHTIWISPDHPDTILLAADQGATLSVNGGRTWSSWYNQPTAQLYHVTADNGFPYRVYGGQQESGSAGVSSRGNDGAITDRDWHPVGVEEYGYAAPDPLHPGIVYGGKVTRYDATTGQVQEVGPVVLRNGEYRFDRTAPLIFSPVDPHILYFAAQVLFKTTDGGHRWQVISPDLTRPDPGVPPSLGVYRADAARGDHRGVIYAIAPSPRDVNLIWVGTDDGLIQVTHDGGQHWENVTPPALTPWSKVTQLDASHFDAQTVYASVSRFRLDDLHPYIYRTHDGGRTWQAITTGLPADGPVNVVREDPVRRGLLYAGTERGVYVSFDDGGHWQSLQLNLPVTSMRDLAVHGDDLIVATHGRSFWILDDVTPLRQVTPAVAASPAHLFQPAPAWRIRRDTYTDTPLPPEEPVGQNPPDGAVLDYYLKADATGPVTLEIQDAAGHLVRRFSSTDRPAPTDAELNVPTYWIRPPQILSARAGMHRFVWDLHGPAPDVLRHEYPISAIPHDTPLEPLGPAVLPGRYTVTLTADAQRWTAPLVVKMDPRVPAGPADLQRQFALATRIAQALHDDYTALEQVRRVATQLAALARRPGAPAEAIARLQPAVAALEGQGNNGPEANGDDLRRINGQLEAVYGVVESADALPTTQAEAAAARLELTLRKALDRWAGLKARDIAALNATLRQAGLPAVEP
ncbi:MAG: glycoside hydrolase [Acidobacteriota bacterium]|nr:glycoside hydrolase [Acidobacteriota bacterium]